MSETTARLKLPFILPGQAQKEVYHNEALARIDAALHAAVEGAPLAVPFDNPAEGQCWIVASGATGAWSGKDSQLAAWTSGGWRFVAPLAGMAVLNKATGVRIDWLGTAWSEGEISATSLIVDGKKVVGARQPAVPSPSGGTTIDQEARAAITALAATLKSHGLTD